MLSSINIIIFLLWLCSALFDYASFCYVWQLKEYRADRFKDFLNTKQGKRFFQSWPFVTRSLLAILAFMWPINSILFIKYIIITIYTLDLLRIAFTVSRRCIKRPRLTVKAITVVLISMGIEGGLFVLSHDWIFLLLLLVLRFFITSFIVYLFSFPTWWMKKHYIMKAKRKMDSLSGITVIGITGSYGKSSVKEFLAHMLSDKFQVVRTPRNINTEIGIAKFILQKDFSNTEIFIVEMGAYKKGEIGLICDMVGPKIGILTAVAEQHLSLFGSLRNIQKAKYELMESLPKDGYAVTNADNDYCRENLHSLQVLKVETFGSDTENNPEYLITDIKSSKEGIECSCICFGEEWNVYAPVVGVHHAFNIAAAAMVAVHLGLSKDEILNAVSTLPKSMHGSLKIYRYGKSTIIDDSYNSNPEGFKAALDVLAGYPSERKRIVITRGMLELGSKSEELHEQMGGEIAFVADELIVTSYDSYLPLKKGVGEKYKTRVLLKEDRDKLLSFIKLIRTEDAVVLLENRMPGMIMDELKKHHE
ncbi:MAG: UDP-N-acetylmuramoyl-tripeptide--D-alanyl-D-alanine ligase [Candidatus Magasanikbacteria bacterium]